MSEKIKKILFVLLLFILPFAVSATVDSSPPDQTVDYSGSSDIAGTTTSARLLTEFSKLGTKIDKLGQCATPADLQQVRTNINTDFQRSSTELIAKILALLLAWQLFLFACLFMAKAKRWL